MKRLSILLLLLSTIITLFSIDYEVRSEVDYKEGLDLLPHGISFVEDFLANVNEYNPEVCVEMLYKTKLPRVPDNEIMSYLINNLKAFSDQVGLQYYSTRRKAMALLIEESYYVTDDLKEKLPDPVINNLNKPLTEYYYQKDTTFGGNFYKLTTNITANAIWLQTENIEKLKVFKIIKALDKGGQRTNFIVYRNQESVYIYALAQIKVAPKIKKVLTYKIDIPNSFKNRMDSIIQWYIKRLEE